MLQSLCDTVAAGLRVPGESIRRLLLMVPLPLAQGLFLLVPVLLLWWICTVAEAEIKGELHGARRAVNLRAFAIAALLLQMMARNHPA